MRVYGASPVYSFVELVFRAKRLFIVSIVLATAIVSILATTRAKFYTATMVVGLSGTPQTSMASLEAGQLGSVRYKLNVLNVVLRNPDFIKTSMRSGNLDKDAHGVQLSELAFDKFCKEVRLAITPNYPSEGILDINCKWQDDRAAAIIKAFYRSYAEYVLGQETIISTKKTETLTALLDNYREQVDSLQKNVNNFTRSRVEQPLDNMASQQSMYIQGKKVVEDMKYFIASQEKRLQDNRNKLAASSEFVDGDTITGSVKDTSGYSLALDAVSKAQANYDELSGKYTSANINVRAALDTLTSAKKVLKEAESNKGSGSAPQISKKMIRNPQHDALVSAVAIEETNLVAMNEELQRSIKKNTEARASALKSPELADTYNWMTEELTSRKSVHNMLRQQLEIAKLGKEEDRQLHTAEMFVMIEPESDQENTGTKSLLLYAAGPLLGLIIAGAFSLVSETLDHSLRTPLEVEKHLNKPVLAVLPRMDIPKKMRRQLGTGSEGKNRPSLPPPA